MEDLYIQYEDGYWRKEEYEDFCEKYDKEFQHELLFGTKIKTMLPLTELKPTDLFAIEVPLGYDNNKVQQIATYFSTHMEVIGEVTKDSISFDVEPYVKRGGIGTYKDYTYVQKELLDEVGLFNALIEMKFRTKEESFYSLLKANGIDINNVNGKLVILKKEA